MKNIIIIGASRAGKSTLTKLLSNKINNIMIIETDILRLAFRDTIVKDTTIHTSSLKRNADYINYVLSYYKYANMYKNDYIKVVDTTDFEPKDFKLFDNSIVICLGYSKLNEEEVINNWQKYDTDNDWTKYKSKDDLLIHAKKHIKESKYLEKESKIYNIKYVDTSYNRKEKLNELVDYVIKEISR